MTTNPDKWIRKGIIDALANQYPVYDMRVPGVNYPNNYIIISTQTKTQNEISKCIGQWDCTVLLDIVTRFNGAGNPGDREIVNDMEAYVIKNMNDFIANGYRLFNIELESSTSLDTLTNTQNVFRQLVRYRILLNEN